jgi:site-specific DNA-cytosine methylase
VLAWEKAARTVIGNARVCQTWASVQDPRIGWATDGVYGDRPHAYGVADPDEPSATIRGKQLLVNSKASVVDPRLTCTPRATAYGMAADDQPSRTILGAQGHDNAVGSAVDPRLGHAPYKDSYGVEDMDRPGSVVRGEHTIRQAPAAAQDPRLSRRKAKPAKDHGIRYDERGWPIPTHELVRLDDGRLVLYGPPRDFTSKRPAYPRMVIRSYDGTWHRPLTTAELARIQGFPVGFEFCGSQAEQRKHVGNAVPPPTAKAIGLECMATPASYLAIASRKSAVSGFSRMSAIMRSSWRSAHPRMFDEGLSDHHQSPILPRRPTSWKTVCRCHTRSLYRRSLSESLLSLCDLSMYSMGCSA